MWQLKHKEQQQQQQPQEQRRNDEIEMSPIVLMAPGDILCNEILTYLDDPSVLQFMKGIGTKRVNRRQLDHHYCMEHGTKLEDTQKLTETTVGIHHENNNQNNNSSSSSSSKNDKNENNHNKSCPTCYAKEQKLKRCGTCDKFYPTYILGVSNGLWCQSCDKMAFCNTCLSHDVACQNQQQQESSSISSSSQQGQQQQRCRTSKCHTCCLNVFTNTICGDYVCDQCGDATETHECDVCGKATCQDTNCLVCADYRLMNVSVENSIGYEMINLINNNNNNNNNNINDHHHKEKTQILFSILIVIWAWVGGPFMELSTLLPATTTSSSSSSTLSEFSGKQL